MELNLLSIKQQMRLVKCGVQHLRIAKKDLKENQIYIEKDHRVVWDV